MKEAESVNVGAAGNLAAVDERDLVRRSQAGDVRAFEEIFRRYQKRIYNFIYQMARNESDAADLTQETFVRVFHALPKLRSPEAFPAWLHRVALNLCRDQAKRPRTQSLSIDQPLDDENDDLSIEIPDVTNEPGRVLEGKELEQRVQEAVGSLSEDHRAVVVMHHLEGMELADIAQSMGCSVGTVKSRLARARETLKRKLGGLFEV